MDNNTPKLTAEQLYRRDIANFLHDAVSRGISPSDMAADIVYSILPKYTALSAGQEREVIPALVECITASRKGCIENQEQQYAVRYNEGKEHAFDEVLYLIEWLHSQQAVPKEFQRVMNKTSERLLSKTPTSLNESQQSKAVDSIINSHEQENTVKRTLETKAPSAGVSKKDLDTMEQALGYAKEVAHTLRNGYTEDVAQWFVNFLKNLPSSEEQPTKK
jgi:uncharacterized protein (UPF0147 family)